ncbi:DUF882 domain-containing protein [Roseibium sp. RKSG952]|nr:DUF882 domain-containing protein [Roseibium sp. RKSG952]
MNRRDLLKGLVCSATGLIVPSFVSAGTLLSDIPLRLYNAHTKERYDIELFVNGGWNKAALLVCDWMMRDWRQTETVQCDRQLYAAMYVVQRHFSADSPIIVNSGYRSSTTNENLRKRALKKTGGKITLEVPAVNSLHIKGKALDFEIKGVSNKALAKKVKELEFGGVGRYPGFVHMDTGRVRQWGLPV